MNARRHAHLLEHCEDLNSAHGACTVSIAPSGESPQPLGGEFLEK
ncbi:mCG147350 [Mus musculus]|nr:mCG147350 [Mus musculus]